MHVALSNNIKMINKKNNLEESEVLEIRDKAHALASLKYSPEEGLQSVKINRPLFWAATMLNQAVFRHVPSF